MEKSSAFLPQNQNLEKNFQYYFGLVKKIVNDTKITSDPSQDNFIKGFNLLKYFNAIT